MKITFIENLNVKYTFWRHGFSNLISRYEINYSPKYLILHEGKNVYTPDLKIDNSQENRLILKWDVVPESGDQSIRKITYEKVKMLVPLLDQPNRLHFLENIEIKATSGWYNLSLHDRNKRITAVKALSVAIFSPTTSGYIHCCHCSIRKGMLDCWEHQCIPGETIYLKPTELADARFHVSGNLFVDWTLEIDPNNPI